MRQKALDFDRIYIRVSIHASVKDATSLRNFIMFRSFVSIHASVKDATHAHDVSNPNKNVSIHASVKDATRIELLGGTNSVFQSTHL